MAPYTHTERVRFGDLDANRHLNNVVFLRYFETARIAFIRELLPVHDPTQPEGQGFGLIFAECHINYRSPVYFDEDVAVECSIGEVRRSAFQVRFTMRVGERVAAEGYGWLVGFDYASEKAARLPDRFRNSSRTPPEGLRSLRVEYSQFDRHPAYARGDDRRDGNDRRGGLRREADRAERMREMAAFAIAMCGGLAVLYLFFVVIGTIDVGDAAVATGAAFALALIWLIGFWRRLRTGATFVQRPDRERRGF